MKYKTTGEFLANIKKEFGGEDKEIVKVAELKRLKQRGKIIEEFVQEFKRAARGSRYKRRSLNKEFRWRINENICQKLIELE